MNCATVENCQHYKYSDSQQNYHDRSKPKLFLGLHECP